MKHVKMLIALFTYIQMMVLMLLHLKIGCYHYSQTLMLVRSQVAYHDYEGVALFDEEKERLVDDLGENKLMILRNYWNTSCW